jgi:hypothetical protein
MPPPLYPQGGGCRTHWIGLVASTPILITRRKGIMHMPGIAPRLSTTVSCSAAPMLTVLTRSPSLNIAVICSHILVYIFVSIA